MTFEDFKANTGDSGSSVRSTQEWMQIIDEVKQQSRHQPMTGSYSGDSINGLSPQLTRNTSFGPKPSSPDKDARSIPMQRKTLRKDPNATDEDAKGGRRRFSRRHSKNGLAAVF